MRKVLIINEGCTSNIGDQAIKSSMESIIRDIGFNTTFLFFSDPSLKKIPAYDYSKDSPTASTKSLYSNLLMQAKGLVIPFIYSRRIKKNIEAAIKGESYDYVIIGGGQLINSSKKMKVHFFSIALYWWTRLIKKYTNATILMIAVGATGSFRKKEFQLYKTALHLIDKIWVRDIFSKNVLSNIFNLEVGFIPDIAFYKIDSAEPFSSPSSLLLMGIYDFDELKSAFSIDFVDRNQYHKLWHDKLEIYRQNGFTVKLFYTTLGDAAETRKFKAYIEKQQSIGIEIITTSSPEELMEIFRKTNYVYSARMHALILALKCNCTVEIFPISQKLLSFHNQYIKENTPVAEFSNEIFKTLSNYFKK